MLANTRWYRKVLRLALKRSTDLPYLNLVDISFGIVHLKRHTAILGPLPLLKSTAEALFQKAALYCVRFRIGFIYMSKWRPFSFETGLTLVMTDPQKFHPSGKPNQGLSGWQTNTLAPKHHLELKIFIL